MDPSLVFSREALRFLTLALLQAQDGGTIRAYRGDAVSLDVLAALEDLGLLEPTPRGWMATDLLQMQPWAQGLKDNPFGIYDD